MRNIGLFAFGLTTCVLVPTLVHVIDAGPNQVAKLVAPGASSLTIGKARIDVALDRSFVDPGAKVHVTLTASAETKQRVTVDVLVLESTGTSGGRVETPPSRIARESVTLDIKDGKAAKTVAFTLPGGRADEMEGTAPFGHYTILVMPPGDVDQLEHLRRSANNVRNPMDDSSGRIQNFFSAFGSIGAAPSPDAADQPHEDDAPKPFGTPGQMARLDVNTRPDRSPITIESPDTALVGFDMPVIVKVRNPSKHALEKITISLSAKPYGIENDYLGIAEDKVTITDAQTVAMKGNETTDVVFHVNTKTTGVLGLFATVRCEGDDCYKDGDARRINDVALDAVDMVSGEQALPTVVLK